MRQDLCHSIFVKLPQELIRKTNKLQIGDVDGDGQDEVAEHSQFSTTCGCSTTTATATTATMTDIVTTTATVTDSTNATFDDSTTATTDSESMSTTTTSDIDTTTTSDITSSPTTADNNTSSTSQSDITTSDVEPAATCAEGESFTINSTVLPDLNGCYFDTGTLIEGEIVYTESGNRFTDQNMVHASTDVSVNPKDIF